MPSQFDIRPVNQDVVSRLMKDMALPRFIATTLAARGFTSKEDVNRFLNPSLEHDWNNPYLIPGMERVVNATEAAIRARKRILVFGDFDVDGVSATSVMARGLRDLGATVDTFIPKRFTEGYSLTEAAYERIKQLPNKPECIITVDCGISCRDITARIKADGIDVIVTDHHEPSGLVPQGIPVADPKLDSACPSSILAGAGVALKLIQILGIRFGKPDLWRNYLDLATLGTIADLMPLVGENRALLTAGIAMMNAAPRPCIAALLAEAGAGGKQVTATGLSYSAIPRLNAAGRLGDAQAALDLLMCDDFDECCTLAHGLEEINSQRRTIEAELSELAKEQAAHIYHGERALVVAGEGWHEGVKGIVASRLVGIYGVPTILFTIDGEEARGSGRTVGNVNLFKAIDSMSDLLTQYGGHDAAVGLTLPAANLDELRKRLCAYMEAQPESAFHPAVRVDAVVSLDELTLENVEALAQLEPFGQDNPKPCYLATNVALSRCRAVGVDKNHLSCALTDGSAQVSAIMFHCADIEALLANDCVVSAAFEVDVDEYRGRRSVKAMLKTLAPAHPCPVLDECVSPEDRAFVTELFKAPDLELGLDAQETADSVLDYEAAIADNREHWEEIANDDEAKLEAAIVSAFIGNAPLHETQREVLDALAAGKNVLSIMATGRGKSLVFQVYAAMRALAHHEMSLFIYPLRALISDQAYHLSESLEQFGLTALVLTGGTSKEDRARTFDAIYNGGVDIVLTTPEFLDAHIQEFSQAQRIGFVVVDEAHHMAEAKRGHREAYGRLGTLIAQLGNPRILALTATANDDAARDIVHLLSIDELMIDKTARSNLLLDDHRNLKNRDDYLASLVATGEKCIVYVNTREQSVMVARALRKRVPQLGLSIGFYNAALSREERKRIEELFRNDVFSVLVATSAFGEGVNIPNIRHVVLYHLPYNEIEFNQMSGRAGRDGKPATIHLLFDRGDARINEQLLADATPDRDLLAQAYCWLRDFQRTRGGVCFMLHESQIKALAKDATTPMNPAVIDCALAVFRELGLIEASSRFVAGETTYAIHVVEKANKTELTESVRYREGLGEREVFHSFKEWAFRCDEAYLANRVSHPIVPKKPVCGEEAIRG